MIHKIIEKISLNREKLLSQVDGTLCFDQQVLDIFLDSPYDLMPNFQGPPNAKLRGGRGKDHPRYGRFVYAFARHYNPAYIVEIGSYAGGTAVCWAKALIENNNSGQLICIDNDTYSKGTYPEITRNNLKNAGLSEGIFSLLNGDSKDIMPEVANKLEGMVDIFLVDADHTYEGAMTDIKNGFPMVRKGGFILVHDVDTERRMDEETEEHPHPVYEAFHDFIKEQNLTEWCILKFIRKHLGIIKV